MKIVFHGYSFIHYAPLYLLIGDSSLPEIEFRNPADGSNNKFIEGNFNCSNDEIHILLLGQDRLSVSPFDEDYISITKLIWQRPLSILKSKKNNSGVWVNYRPGNSFQYLLQKMFQGIQNQYQLSNEFGIDVFNDEEFQMLENGQAEFAVTWNPWKIKDYPNVEKIKVPFPILPFGWTCLIVKKEELKNPEKLAYIKLLITKIYEKVFDIYKFYENEKLTLRNYHSKRTHLNSLVTSIVSDADKPHVASALKLLAKSKIWFTNEIYKDIKLKDLSKYLLDESEKEATKSAVAEIVNRNYSHHIGSHVSHRATFDKIAERLGLSFDKIVQDENILHTIIQMENKLNRYKDERNEFISAIAAGVGIHAASLFGDVLLPFIENSLLMDNIAANENINFLQELKHNRLQIKCTFPNGEMFAEYLLENENKLASNDLPYFRVVSDFNSNFYSQKKYSNDDIEIGIPGALGKHAFYSILENFIRNTAKHGAKKIANDKDVEINIIVENKDDNYYRIKLTDNISQISDNDLENLQKGIRLEIRRKEKLGLQDMKINACLLAGKEITEENCANSLTVKRDETTQMLAYEFSVIKAKKVVIIHPEYSKPNLKSKGVFSFASFSEFNEIETNQSFQFAIIDSSLLNTKTNIEDYFTFLPSRVLIYNNNADSSNSVIGKRVVQFSDDTLFNTDNSDELLMLCWKIWLGRWCNEKTTAGLNLYLDQGCNVHPTHNWIYAEEKINTTLSGFAKYSTWFKTTSSEILTTKFKDAENQILYDRHGFLLGDENLGTINFLNRNTYNLIDKNSKDFDKIFTASMQQDATMITSELIEAGLLRILIIDERVQERSATPLDSEWQLKNLGFEKQGKFNLFDALWASKIFAATHIQIDDEIEKPLKLEIDESQNCFLKLVFSKSETEKFNLHFLVNFSQINDGFTDYEELDNGTYRLTIDQLGVDAIIIHRTILKDLMSKFGFEFLQQLEKLIPFVFITTGGGVVHDINRKLKVIPFGALQDFILNNNRIAKYSLTQTLMNLTANKF